MQISAPKLTHKQSSDYGSGTQSGAGYGNKMSSGGDSTGLDSNYGSGNTGAGFGSSNTGSSG